MPRYRTDKAAGIKTMWSVEYISESNLWGVYYNGVLQSTAEIEQEARELVNVLNAQKESGNG